MRDRRERAPGDRPRRATTWCRSASPTTADGCWSPGTRGGSRSPAPTSCPRSTARARRSCSRSDRRGSELVVHEPGARAAHASARSTSCSRCCTGRGARTAPSRGCSRWPASGTSARVCWPRAVGMDKHYMKVVLAGAGLPVLPVHGDRATGRGRPTAPRARRASRRWATRSSSSRPAAARASASARCTAPTSSTRRSRRRARTTRRCSSRSRPSGGREIECGVLEGSDGPGRPAWSPRSRVDGGTSSTTSRRSTCPRSARGSTCRPTCPTTVTARIRELPRGAFEALVVRGPGPGGLLLLPDERVVINEINTMPGFTPSSMFPRMWAATGARLPRARRPAAPARPAPRTGLR